MGTTIKSATGVFMSINKDTDMYCLPSSTVNTIPFFVKRILNYLFLLSLQQEKS